MPRNKGSQKKWASLDNKTYLEKSRLRKQMLSKLDDMPVILETHGGKVKPRSVPQMLCGCRDGAGL